MRLTSWKVENEQHNDTILTKLFSGVFNSAFVMVHQSTSQQCHFMNRGKMPQIKSLVLELDVIKHFITHWKHKELKNSSVRLSQYGQLHLLLILVWAVVVVTGIVIPLFWSPVETPGPLFRWWVISGILCSGVNQNLQKLWCLDNLPATRLLGENILQEIVTVSNSHA